MNVREIPAELIDADPEQPRTTLDETTVRSIAMSMRELGQQQPVIVYETGSRFGLLDGHQRLAAAKLIKRPSLHAIVLAEKPDKETLLVTQLSANCLRSDLKPMEKARAFHRLMQSRGCTQSQLAAMLHLSSSSVTRALSLLNHPPEIQAKIDAGVIPESTAYAIQREGDEASREQLVAAALNGTLSRDAASQAVSRKRRVEKRQSARVSCSFSDFTVTVASAEAMTLGGLIEALQRLLREARKSERQGFDVSTFQKMLADQARVTPVA